MIPEPEPRKKLWQRRPLLLGLLIILALLILFLIVITVLGKITPSTETSSSSFGFGNKVAILKIEGVIFESEPVLKELRNFRKDRSIKAIVLRVDSPGGAVAPSQEIYEELRRFKKEKPVVASMASVAASGGYYVCLPASYIYASPGTITGSIGVIMQTTDIGELLKWMKVKEEIIKSGKYKDAGTPFRSLTDEERKYFENLLKNVHQQFQTALKESRGLSQEKVEEVSDGRIFTGEQAKEMGLIDDLGNLEDAIKKAGELAGIKGEPEVVWPRRRYGFFEEFGAELSHKILNRLLNSLSNPIWYLEQGTILRTQRSGQ